MTITEGRRDRMKIRQKRRRKLLGLSYGAVITLITLAALILILSLAKLYQDTKVWSNSKSGVVMNTLAPEFASDYPDAKTSHLRQLSIDIAKANDHMLQTMTLPENVDDLTKKIEGVDVSGGLSEQIKRFTHYKDLLLFTKTAYENIDTERLGRLISDQNDIMLAQKQEGDDTMLDTLTTILGDYNALNNFIYAVLPNYGTIEGDKWFVYTGVTDLSEVVAQLDMLSQFPYAKSLHQLIASNMEIISTNNKSLAAKTHYDTFKQVEESLSGIYVQVSELATYKDLVKNGWSTKETHNPDDKILEIRYNGYKLEQTDWVKVGLGVTFILEERQKPKREDETISLPPSTTQDAMTENTTDRKEDTENVITNPYRPDSRNVTGNHYRNN